MNLNKLFEIQSKLDQAIVKKKGLEGQDLLPKKILALQVELGELANEWRGFKFWSEDQEPRTECRVSIQGFEDGEILDTHEYQNPLLEEYVDCLHFILNIGLNIGYSDRFNQETMNEYFESGREEGITGQFITLIWCVGNIYENPIHYEQSLFELIRLGEMLGFTWEQIEQAYLDKNKVNHARQESGY